jgi:two-component system chemotaxis response regulator CheY
MRILIVEDDFISRNVLQHILSEYGKCDIAVDGQEAVDAFKRSWGDSKPYDLICMDIMMPGLDGHEALNQIRDFEKQLAVQSLAETKVIMTSSLNDNKNVADAFYKGGASSYFVKPIDREKLIEELRLLGLLAASS